MAHRDIRIDNVDAHKQGWGIAALVCLLAVACAFGAWSIHKATYQHPRMPINIHGS